MKDLAENERVQREREKAWKQRRVSPDESLLRFCDMLDVPECAFLDSYGKPYESRFSKKLRYGSYNATLITQAIARQVYRAANFPDCTPREKEWRELALIVGAECVFPNNDDYVVLYKYASKLAIVLYEAGSTALYRQLCDCLETFTNPPKLRTTYKPRRNTK